MKNALRDIILIVVLFGVIIGAPLVMHEMSSSDTEKPVVAEKTQPVTETKEPETNASKVTMDGMPPQPKPAEASDDKGSAMDNISNIEITAARPPDSGNATPYQAKDEMPVPTLMADNSCSAVDMGAKSEYDPKIETRKGGDSFVMPAADLPKMTLDGGGGPDTLKVTDGGPVDADGTHLVRIEIYDLRNGQPNTLRIFAQGLASMDGRHALVIGDPQGDTVGLDPCLDWNDPIAIDDGAEPLLRFDAHDKAGNQASVSVTAGVKVMKPASQK